MKKFKIILLFLALFCAFDSYSMKRDRDVYEKKVEKEKELENENAIKKFKANDSSNEVLDEEIKDEPIDQETSQSINPKDDTEYQPIDQETGLPINLYSEEDIAKRIEEIEEFGEKINYPSSYIQDLIEPEIKRIDTSNLIVGIHLLPSEVIELILLFCMISIFNDTVGMLTKIQRCYKQAVINASLDSDSSNSVNPPFREWRKNYPYPQMFAFLNAFPLKNICRKLMGSPSFKRNLSGCMKNILIKFFRCNDQWASNFLVDLMYAWKLLKTAHRRYKLDMLLFARCLAECGIHPNQNCYYIKDGKRTEYTRIPDISFNLLEFAICIDDYNFTRFLIDEKDGDVTKISQTLKYLITACKNDSIYMYKLIKENKINWCRQPVTEALIEATKNKSYKILAEAIRFLIWVNDFKLFKVLIDNGLDVNKPNLYLDDSCVEPIFDEEIPLMCSVEINNFEFTKKLIEEWKADVNASSNDGRRALSGLVDDNSDGVIKMAEYLIQEGADINFKVDGDTLLHNAACRNSVKLLRFFKERGLDVDSVNNNGSTPLMKAVVHKANDAAIYLIECGANVNAKDERGRSVAFYCFRLSDSKFGEMVQYLIKKGINIDDVDLQGRNLLHAAIEFGNAKAVKFLVKNYGFDINQQDNKGIKPSMLAKAYKKQLVVDLLEPDIHEKRKDYLLDCKKTYIEILEYLRNKKF